MPEPLTFVSRVVIKGRIEDVWREITKTDEPQLAMFNSRMFTTVLGPGAPIRMRSPDNRYTGVVGQVLEYDPPHRFSHTMKFTAYDDPVCRVTYELKETPAGVEFTLTSEEVPAGTRTAKDMARGGDFIAGTLKAVVENGRPPLGTRLLYVLFGLLAFFNPKKSRTEHWPLEQGNAS
jgi:uncharacterized protein YndB with AHSA1/START domain